MTAAAGITRVNERITNLTAGNMDDPEHDQVSKQIAILMVMLAIFSVIGSVGNGLVIFVFQRVRDKTTAQVFIITLAVIDLFTCMVIIPMTMFVEYTGYDIKFDFLCKLYHFLITSKIPLSAFIMVAIAFDRYFCICHPLRRIMTIRRARIIVVCLSLLACFFGIITSLFYGVYQVVERVDSKKIDEVMGTNFTKSVADVDEMIMLNTRNEMYTEIRRKLISTLRERNLTFLNGAYNDSLPIKKEVIYMGICHPSKVIFDDTLFHVYQKTYTAVYPMCLISVMVLYLMIYRFMCLRRSKKLQQKLIMCSYVHGDGTFENTRLVSEDGEEKRKSIKNRAAGPPGDFPTPLSPTAVVIRSTSTGNITTIFNGDSKQTIEETNKHGNHLVIDTLSRNKISSSPTPTTATTITPTHDNDDNTPILNNNFYNSNGNGNGVDRGQDSGGRRHSHLPEQKYQWHKNRDSMKRYKGKKRRRSQYSYDADRLREENRSANVRTALMLFTVTLVFIVAFVPAWVMAHRLIPSNLVVFYLYFSYNVANPFIYAFMNHIFKDYMRKMFTCRDFNTIRRRSS